MGKYMRYENGVLAEYIDTRTVSTTAAERISIIKAECAKAIEATGVAWMVQREVTGGSPVPQDVKDACAAYRARSNDLEAQISTLAGGAADDDKAVCDAIEVVMWA